MPCTKGASGKNMLAMLMSTSSVLTWESHGAGLWRTQHPLYRKSFIAPV